MTEFPVQPGTHFWLPSLRHRHLLGPRIDTGQRMTGLLTEAARLGRGEMLASDRPDRMVWPDRTWE
ncbi:hypothetical protein [Streptomyces sp. NPDC048565]|uniref:hypothetical protein n=1 Tax=Streptomyces sp. NPDC048565 TaxID=3155266 RepID=UPI00342E5D72